ncbi:CUGBP Elav family like [Echinococcus multilocularis]|uniref:CUGBP Elav family like n=1 Tax=Echinococcus multilocularis TaxID=6211 RepID=A0A068YEK6_ECHMU|nr:CUGBP Elav family like [Echinococcus multilocularis]
MDSNPSPTSTQHLDTTTKLASFKVAIVSRYQEDGESSVSSAHVPDEAGTDQALPSAENFSSTTPTTASGVPPVQEQVEDIYTPIFTAPPDNFSIDTLPTAAVTLPLMRLKTTASIDVYAGSTANNAASTMDALYKAIKGQPIVVQPVTTQSIAPSGTLQVGPAAQAMAINMAKPNPQQQQVFDSLIPNPPISSQAIPCDGAVTQASALSYPQHSLLAAERQIPVQVLTAPLNHPSVAPGPVITGPENCNLFINFLPQACDAIDLFKLFSPFGRIISTKIFVNRATYTSKCFGFVSYDNPSSAHRAITEMNGYVMGSKRLRVELKRPKATRRN